MNIGEWFGGKVCAAFLLLAMVWLSGCATIGAPGKKDATAIHQGQKTLLLFRVVCTDDKQGQAKPTCDFNLNLWQLGSPSNQIEISPKMYSPDKATLSKSSGESGWHYVLVAPGTYCAEIAPTGPASYFVNETNRSVYYLSIATNQAVAYAGTVVFQRHIETRGKNFLTRTKDTDFQLSDFRNETAAAKSVAEEALAGLGEVTPQMFVPYDTPPFGQKSRVAEMRSGTETVATVGGDNSRAAALGSSPFLVPGSILLEAGAHSGGNSGGIYVMGAGLVLVAVGFPVALTTEAIVMQVHHKKWAPYEAALQKEIAAFHLDERLREQLAEQIGDGKTNATVSPNAWVQVQPYRVILRGDEHQKFAMEVAVRVQLFSATNSLPVWEHNYVRGCHQPLPAIAICETPVPSSALPRKLEEFRGDAGAELMRKELESAVDELTREIASRI